jgi:hypothetical protein
VGAILPFKRIVAYYGNFYSTKMGILGEYDKGTVLAKLKSEKAAWEAADPETPVVMGIDYIAVLHEPIVDSGGGPFILGLSRGGGGRQVSACWGGPGFSWGGVGAFAFPVSQ